MSAAGGGIALLSLLAMAACLQPDPSGRGTHQQLGLPPCTFQLLFHVPCPSCGMTTSWAWLTRGEIIMAIKTNSAGVLLGLTAIVGAPWLLLSGAVGHWIGRRPRVGAISLLLVTLVALALTQWIVRLWQFR